MKILLFTEACAAGVGRHVMDLADGLCADGHQTHIVYSSARVDPIFAARIAGQAHCFELPLRRNPHWTDLPLALRLRRYAIKHGPFDILHGHSTKAGLLVRLIAIGLPGAVIYTPHAPLTMNFSLPFWLRALFAAVETMLCTLTWRIIAVSKEEATHLAQWGVPKDKICIVPNGIER